MKRHPALQDLSRDHHHVLFRCQRFRRLLAEGAPWNAIRPLVDEFLVFFESDLGPHFREEDDLVLAVAEAHAALREPAERLRREHGDLREQVSGLADARETEAMAREHIEGIAGALADHAQREELFFEQVQRVLSEAELRDLGRHSAEFRARHRAPDASGPRAGRG